MKFFFLLLFFLAASAMNGQTIKLKVSGITATAGEDILAFEAGDTIPVNTIGGTGGGGGVSVSRFAAVKFKKVKDSSSAEFHRRSINAAATPDFTFEFYDAGNTLYYKISLKEVYVIHFSYLSPECNGCSKLFHEVWLDYRKIEWTDVLLNVTWRYNLSTRTFY